MSNIMNVDNMKLIIQIIILLFLFVSGVVCIHYGNKIKDGKISNDDKQAGEFIFSFGIIGLIANIISIFMFGYYFNKLNILSDYRLIVLYIGVIIFTIASNIILIIYGLKMHQNNICTDINCPKSKCINDFKIAEFIVAFGSICIIFSLIVIFFLIYKKLISSKKKEELISSEKKESL